MKISKKTIIILVVVAVAVYLLWKRGKGSGSVFASALSETSAPVGTSVDNIESIIAASGMTSTDASYVRSLCAQVDGNLTQKANIEMKAIERGLTYAQMCVLDAFWMKYCRMVDGVSQFKEGTSDAVKSYYWKVTGQIKKL